MVVDVWEEVEQLYSAKTRRTAVNPTQNATRMPRFYRPPLREKRTEGGVATTHPPGMREVIPKFLLREHCAIDECTPGSTARRGADLVVYRNIFVTKPAGDEAGACSVEGPELVSQNGFESITQRLDSVGGHQDDKINEVDRNVH